jgi:recombination protein RecT
MNGYEAQFRPRFMGLMKLARQSGEITDIDGHEVYKWDHFDYAYGASPFLKHVPGNKPMDYSQMEYWGVTHAYCTWEIGGKTKFEVIELPDIVRIMNRTSSKFKNKETGEEKITGPWVNDFPEMCRKTVVRRASKYMPLSAEKMKGFATAVNLDDKREGGESVTLKDGEVVDVTEFSESADEPQEKAPEQTQSGKSQLDDLESKMAAKKTEAPKQQPKQQPQVIDNPPQKQAEQPKQPTPVSRLEVPRINGAADWTTWLKLSEAAVNELPTAQRIEWKAKHRDLLDNCEFNVPDQMETLVKMLP